MKINLVFIEGDGLYRTQHPSSSSMIAPSLLLNTKLREIMTEVQPQAS